MGTKFPFDDKWIIEAISDSTLYPLYYLISLYANDGRISPDNMSEAFFDYVVLGKGELASVSTETGVSEDLLTQIKKDVEYWYPLDINLGGKEHMTVHFPVFLFNHRAILPDNMQPRGIVVNWYITGKKNKISKSKGGAQPIPGAVELYGVDAMRLYYSHVASMFVDVEWSEDLVMTYRQRLDRIIGTVEDLIASESSEESSIDAWLVSRFNRHLDSIMKSMEKYDLRQMATLTYFEMLNDIRWYNRRGGRNKDTLLKVLRIWIQCMMPITPHVAEELWEMAGFEGLVSGSEFPQPEPTDDIAEYSETFVRDLLSDVAQIRKIAETDPKMIYIYTSPMWKRNILTM